MQRIANYILYNNSFTLVVVFLLISGGSVLAANEDVRTAVVGTVVSSEDRLLQIDNSFIIDADLDDYDFRVQVEGIEEDDEFYYATYSYTTIEVLDGVWQEVSKEDVLQVSKKQLGEKDLGLFIAKQLKEFVDSQRQLLAETQTIERNLGKNNKVVERKYDGLVGRFLDPEDVTFDGYDPVVKEPVKVAVENKPPQVENLIEPEIDPDSPTDADPTDNADSTDPVSTSTTPSTGGTTGSGSTSTTTATTTDNGTGTTTTSTSDTTPPTLTLKGSAAVEIEVGQSFADPGATATDSKDGDLTSKIAVTGSVDTSTAGSYKLTYKVKDAAGNEAVKVRTVTVAEPEPEPEDPEEPTTPPESADSTDDNNGTSTPAV